MYRMSSNNQDNNLVTTEEAAKMLYLSRDTIREYIKKGKINAFKSGKQYLIPKENVQDLASRNDLKYREIKSIQGKEASFILVEVDNPDLQQEDVNEGFKTFVDVLVRSLKLSNHENIFKCLLGLNFF